MPILKVAHKRYQIEGIDKYSDRTYTKHSQRWQYFDQAAAWTQANGAILQSLEEAVAFRIEAQGQHNAHHRQITRTGAYFFWKPTDGNFKMMVGFDSGLGGNELLRHAKEYSYRDSYRIPMNRDAKEIIRWAGKKDRVVQVGKRDIVVPLESLAECALVRAHMGSLAIPYAHYLQAQGFKDLHVYIDVPTNLRFNEMEIKPVMLGPKNQLNVNPKTENYRPNMGFACGVIHPLNRKV